MTRPAWRRCFAAMFLLPLVPASVLSQLPALYLKTLSPPGAQRGSSVELTIGGDDLDGVRALVFSHPGIVASAVVEPPSPHADALREPPRRVAQRFQVTIDAAVPLGVHEVRAIGRFGISNPRGFQVGLAAESREVENNDSIETAQVVTLGAGATGVTINGASDRASDLDHYRIDLAAGERVFVECVAWQIDSQLDPLLTLFDPRGIQIARKRVDLRRDAVVDLTASSAGAFTLQVRDETYRGGGEFFYRLAVHRRPRIDSIFPPVVARGVPAEVTLIGRNLPGATRGTGSLVEGTGLEQLVARIEAPGEPADALDGVIVESRDFGIDGFLWRWRDGELESDPVFVSLAAHPVVLEIEPNDDAPSATRVTTPCEVAGRFWPRRDRDWIEFEAKKGDSLRVEVVSQRLGLAVDPAFTCFRVNVDGEGRESLQEISFQDDGVANIGGSDFDTTSDDPSWLFAVPDDARYRIELRDLYGDSIADARNVWCLSLRPERPDFRLVATPGFPAADQNKEPGGTQSPFVRRGGYEEIGVHALRRDGFQGPIELVCEGLPPGVRQLAATIAAGQSSTQILLVANDDAAEWAGTFEIVGRATIGSESVRRVARGGTRVWDAARARVTRDVVLGVSGAEPTPLRVEVTSGTADDGYTGVVETAIGGKVQLPVHLARASWSAAKVDIAPEGTPKNVELKNFAIDEKSSDATPEIVVKKDAAVGEFRFWLTANTEIQYERDPQRLESARARKTELDDLIAKSSLQAFEAAKAMLAAAESARVAADAAAAEAAKAAEEAAARAAAAQAMMADAEKARANADLLAQAATAAQTRAAKEIEEADKANKAQKRRFRARTPVLLRVHAAAFAFDGAIAPDGARVLSGASVEVPVRIRRLFGFNSEVELAPRLADGVKMLRVAAEKIATDSSDGRVQVEVDGDAPPGEHTVTLAAKGKFGDAEHAVEATFRIVVLPKPAPAPTTEAQAPPEAKPEAKPEAPPEAKPAAPPEPQAATPPAAEPAPGEPAGDSASSANER